MTDSTNRLAPSDQEPEPQDPAERSSPTTVVGIGASAGGLAALQAFFDEVPSDTGMAFVVVTHMDPNKESMLPELLQSHTQMPVHQVQGRVKIEADHVYVIPPARHIVVADAHLDVEAFEESRGRRAPIDHFFRSLVEAHSDGCVAVILSGGGADGAVGVKAVKEQGGLLLVQHPDEAEYDSMPRAAIGTGLADVVLPVRELAHKLVQYVRNGVEVPHDIDALSERELDVVHRILTQIQARTGHDFRQYKRSTVLRRIQRRLQITGHTSLKRYLTYLRNNPNEAKILFNDLLIGVTSFFRDADAWEALAEQVIPDLFAGKHAGDSVRVWTIGCATGEEAYSLGILLLEHAATRDLAPGSVELQVFASDLDDDGLTRAREGLYPEAIEADVSPERLNRFFVKEGHHYRVRRELRDIVLFTNHSVLRDPPFSRLDLISCRNLLIYLDRDLQDNVFDIFHYALVPEGYLFLGTAESAEMADEMFRPQDKTHRIYRAKPWRGEHPHVPRMPLAMRSPAVGQRLDVPEVQHHTGSAQWTGTVAGRHERALESYGPPSVLVDRKSQVLHVSETAGRYLLLPRGPLTDDLLKLVRPALQFELRTALFQAFNEGKAVVSAPVYVQFNGTPRRVVLSVRPLRSDEDAAAAGLEVDAADGHDFPLALVFFLEHEAGEEADEHAEEAPAGEGQHRAMVEELQAEVHRLRERLQTTIEEYKTSNEELKAANEELQSMNEEYRSATEELETSKEELQSVNEELQTVNAELKNKLEEISRAHSDLENLMQATEVATLFLDRELRIQRYTPPVRELFNVRPSDRGRPLDHLTYHLRYDGLVDDARQVLRTLVPVERTVRGQEGRWFLLRVRPYLTVDDRIDGVALTFVDITEQKQAAQELRDTKEYSEKIVDTVREGLLVLEQNLTVGFANQSFYEMFAVDAEMTVGKRVYDLGHGAWDIPELRTLLEEILPQQEVFNDYRVEHEFDHVGRRVMLLNARRLDHLDQILLAIEDITEREVYEQELRESEERYRTLFESIDEGFCIVEVLFDANEEPVDYRFLETNPAFAEHTGLYDAEGKRMRELEPRHEEFWFERYGRVALTGEPERFTQQAQYLGGRWYDVYAFRIGRPEERQVAVLFTDVTTQKETEEALRQLTESLEEQVQERTEQLHELAVRLTRAEQAERHRIGQVLHDDLQQWLYSVQLSLDMIGDELRDESTGHEGVLQEKLETAYGRVKEAIRRTRRLSVDLSPPILEGEGLTEAFGWLSSQMQEQYDLTVEVNAEGSFQVPDQDLRVLLFQSVRELLFNVVKHADVSSATVRLERLEDELGIQVSDEGAGFDIEEILREPPSGRGLADVRERLELVGGRMEVASEPSEGTWITLYAPLAQSDAAEDPDTGE